MPKSILNDIELEQILTCIIKNENISLIDEILSDCHEYNSSGNLMSYEKYFHKKLFYSNYDIKIYKLLIEEDSIVSADIQFKRKARFQVPYFSRNYFLFKKLKTFLESLYENEKKLTIGNSKEKQIHYKATPGLIETTPFEEWDSECALYDEPYSSGQTPSELTAERNDFVIIRFKRK